MVYTWDIVELRAPLTKGLKMKTLEIKLDAFGFENLWYNSMAWAGYGDDWKKQNERFIGADSLTYDWTWAYWFTDWVDIVIAGAFLESCNEKFSVYSDEAGGYVILTNYASPWGRR